MDKIVFSTQVTLQAANHPKLCISAHITNINVNITTPFSWYLVWNSIYVHTMYLYTYVVLTFSHWINWSKNMKHSPEKLSKYVIAFAQIVSHFWITLMCPKVFMKNRTEWNQLGYTLSFCCSNQYYNAI